MLKLKKFLPALLIAMLALLLYSLSYKSNTSLSGWDNLQSELDLPLNIGRSLSVGWQEYQGLGLVGGMGHGANLARELILILSSVVFPQELIRYFWHFLMLLMGPLGMYFFLKKVIDGNTAPFTGAVYYLLNLATVQYFYVPFEAFSSFFGFFPWLLFSLINYLENPNKKTLLLFFAVSLLSTTIFIVQTLFVVYISVACIFLVDFLLRNKKRSISKIAAVLTVIFSANAFWLMSVVYFSGTNVSVVDNAKINSIATVETYLQNQDFGKISDIVQLKGFWFEYLDLQQGEYNRLLSPWVEHVNTPVTGIVLLLLFAFAIAGIFVSVAKKKNKKWSLSFLTIFLLGIFMLTSGRAPFGFIFRFLQENIPLFGQIFRSTFTKWSIVVSFAVAWGLSVFIAETSKLPRKSRGLMVGTVSLLIIAISTASVLPVFQGKLIGEDMKVKHPEAYSNLYAYFDSQPLESRVVLMPVHTFWGWNFYDWGYRGSGFLWYGIEQPILDRAFDVWSKHNETFYHEASTALYKEDPTQLARVFDKYDVSYALLDESVIIPGGDSRLLRYDYIKQVLPQIGAKVAWKEGPLTVYKLPNFSQEFIGAPESYSLIQNELVYTRQDNVYSHLGDYVIGSAAGGAIYPFSFLSKEEITAQIEFTGDGKASLAFDVDLSKDSKVYIPGFSDQVRLPGTVKLSGENMTLNFKYPYSLKTGEKQINSETNISTIASTIDPRISSAQVWINDENVEVKDGQSVNLNGITISKDQTVNINVYDSASERKVDVDSSFYSNTFTKCWEREGQSGLVESSLSSDVFAVRTQDAVGCNAVQVGKLDAGTEVAVSLEYRSDSGARPHFCFEKEGTSDCLHDEIFYSTPTSLEWATVSRKFLVPENGNYWLIVGGRPPDEKGKAWEIQYKSPEITTNKLHSSFEIPAQTFSQLWEERNFVVPRGAKNISVEIPLESNGVDFANFRTASSANCDVLKRGFADKVYRGGRMFYSAEDYGAMCDFATVGLSTKNEYLMRIQGENKNGRSLKAFLYNGATQRNDLEVLMDEGNFDNTFSLLSWPQKEGEYSLTLETRSFGQLSENQVEDVTFYNFPITWLSQWRIGEVEKYPNYLKIVDSQKSGTALYKAKTIGSGLLKLSQGYDGGWIAYSPSSGFLRHVKVNSWANGWFVPEGGTQVVYIFFWPQLLQWLGFGLLIITPIAIWKGSELTKRIRKHKISSAS